MALGPLVAAAQPAQAPGQLVEKAVVQADSSATVTINGLEVELAVSTGTVDHVTLNAAAAARLIERNEEPSHSMARIWTRLAWGSVFISI